MIEFNGSEYYIDINRIYEIVSFAKNDDAIGQEITDSYERAVGNDLQLTSKIIRETKTNGDTAINNIKYDLIKMFLDVVLDIDSSTELTQGTCVAVTTLIKERILVKYE